MKKYCLKALLAIISFTILFSISSCTGNFEELNTSKTNPPSDFPAPSEKLAVLIPSLVESMHLIQQNRNQMIDQFVGNQYGGYFATTQNWQGTNFGTFNPSLDWMEQTFTVTMPQFNANYVQIMKETQEKGYVYAWVNIMRVNAMLRVTDTYGPIPYSQIGKKDDDKTPYDDVPDLYRTMINELTTSIHELNVYLLDSPNGIAGDFADTDYVYGGNMSKWLKFATSMKLRLAVRIAHVDTEFAKKAISEAVAGDLLTSNGDNAYINGMTKNPYHLASNDWGDLAVSATLSTYMNAFNDPRRAAYMTSASGVYRGVRTGIANINKTSYSDATKFSKPNFTQTSSMLLFCAAETAFLQAEAALQGWIPGGESAAKDFYEQGIKLSMDQWGVAIGNYLTGTASPSEDANKYQDPITNGTISVPNKITVSWNDYGTTSNTRLEKIITQKWLANYTLGFEAWSEYRRTGFPQIFPAQNNLSSSAYMGTVNNSFGRLVRRLAFPNSQVTANPENVAIAKGMLGGPDEASTDLWWAKKN